LHDEFGGGAARVGVRRESHYRGPVRFGQESCNDFASLDPDEPSQKQRRATKCHASDGIRRDHFVHAYTFVMARGWESKSVESQQHDAPTAGKKRLSAEEVQRRSKHESLELSRTRVVRELEGTRSEVHRAALENALRFLDEELKKV
jgi:hypothetical protein